MKIHALVAALGAVAMWLVLNASGIWDNSYPSATAEAGPDADAQVSNSRTEWVHAIGYVEPASEVRALAFAVPA